MPPPLVLRNADVRTMRPGSPRASAILIRGERIIAAGEEEQVREEAGPRYDDIDCRGDLILPGFVDAHIHLLAYAASLRSIDASASAVSNIPQLLAAIRDRAERTPAGAWIRATGYRETELAERRHPTRWELDAASPDQPVRLIHGSGHASVFNSRGLARIGIANESEEPAGSQISRRLEDGEPDGLLLEMNELIESRMPRPDADELRASVAEACRRLNAAGITSVHDLGVHNDAATLTLLEDLRLSGTLSIEVLPAIGIAAFRNRELPDWRGIVKLMINELGGTLLPARAELEASIREIAAAGATVAVHAVSANAVRHAVAAFTSALGDKPGSARGHRIEHAAVCPPRAARTIARLGIVAVCNPGFLLEHGDRFLREVPIEEQPWLHNPAVLAAAGVRVAAGSDAPVSTPDPVESMRAAMTRRSSSGAQLPGPLLNIDVALRLHTSAAAVAGGQQQRRGSLAAGMIADLVRLPHALLVGATDSARDSLMTMRNGTWIHGQA